MKRLYIITILSLLGCTLLAQDIIRRDATIHEMVNEVSVERLEANVRKLASFGTRHSLSDTKSDSRGIGAARRWVLSEFQEYAKSANGRMETYIDEFEVKADGRRIPKDVKLANVMAVLNGTDANDSRVFVISGHLDSRASDVMDAKTDAPGANDDASGVAAVIELARIMAKREFSPTIIFLAVSGEEQGLIGARHLAEKAKKEGWNITAMLNNDMIGNARSDETELSQNTIIRVFSEATSVNETEQQARMRRYTGGENDNAPRQLARYVKEIGERYVDHMEVKLIYRNDRYLRGGDHTPFVENDFTAVRLCEYNENYKYQHQDVRVQDGIQYGDLPEYIDYDYLRKASGINLAVLATLAKAPGQPKQVKIDVSKLSNNSTLSWDKPETGTAPTGYYVLMRETHWPFWQKKYYTENTTLTLPYTKDNYHFAVQAVSNEGHESLMVFPAPDFGR